MSINNEESQSGGGNEARPFPEVKPLSVLILHNVEDLYNARKSTLDYIFCFERYSPRNNYLYQRITLALTETIRATSWDVVILDSTALGICTFRPRELFLAEKEKWSFLRSIPAIKVAFPQDDANHGGLLDEWFEEIAIDAMYSVRPEHKRLLYPKTSARAEVRRTYSGFVDDHTLNEIRCFSKPFAERQVDLGQRVTFYPPRGGRLARVKGQAAEIMKKAGLERGLKVDISTRPEDTLLGTDWYRFLGNCKFVPGAEGGMGLWDPYGVLYDRIEEYLTKNPGAGFEEVEEACFPGLDGKYSFPGFSPRILETAMCGCCQILVEGEYLGVLRPYKHYIPLRRDFSNLDEVFDLMRDEARVQSIIAAAYEALIESPEFRYSNFVRRFEEHMRRMLGQRGREPASIPDFAALRVEHWRELVELVTKREIAAGFAGPALAERVGDVLSSQWVEPLVHARDESDVKTSRSLCRDEAVTRAAELWMASKQGQV